MKPIGGLPSWSGILAVLDENPPGSVVRVPRHWLPHPLDEGATRSIGLPVGQRADYRWRLPDCSGLHAHDFGTHYEAHVDHVDPACDLVEHARQDAPELYVSGAACAGLLLGLVLGGNRSAALAGAGLGALVGLLTLPEPESDPGS